jgi:pimeloyl-ACP methyl ester carboxylesterase
MPYFRTEDGIDLYYHECGDKNGQPFIALHGWLSEHSTWNDLFAGMGDYHCFAPDFRGMGKSSLPKTGISMGCMARDVKALIEHLGMQDVNILGYSMGAAVLYKYVELFGTKPFKKMILCDMSPKLLNDDEWKEGLGQGVDDPMYNIMAIEEMLDDYTGWNKRYWCMMNPALEKAFPGKVLDTYLGGVRATNTDYVQIAMYASFLLQDYRPMLHKIDIPTGIFFGDPGSVYQPKTARYIADHITGPSKVVLFKGGTHLFGWEQPDKFLKETREFLAEPVEG